MADDEGFFSRWSRRKAQARQEEQAVDRPTRQAVGATPAAAAPIPTPPSAPLAVEPPAAPGQPIAPPLPEAERPTEAAPPLPTLDDVRALTPDADFSRFVAPEVSPDVRNAAMKKLFSDPFFNEMDGLDIYIDDYSKPDPLPASLARKLVSAQFMKLFDEPQDEQPSPVAVPSSELAPRPAPLGQPPEAVATPDPEPAPESDPPQAPRQP
ncbi:DUF3306 domain-containing protein [Tepidicella baoligensis]|uniref:DUF3306 domain-containing protein n=1 Tax=Tepidicella baoligensis TaxID=2707016 RepID=UPI001FE4D525|nr:DUF3306 domain-containing protein [Tepidicella baoligensis]